MWIKCLFWNINKKNLVQEIITIIIENSIDVLILAEAENLDVQYLLSELERHGRELSKEEILPGQRGIVVFADKKIEISTYKEEKYFSAYEQDQDDNSFYWYTFDQILLRPELIDDFIWHKFGIIEQVGKCSLIKNDKI